VEKSLQATTTGAPEEDSEALRSEIRSSLGLWREPRPFLRPPDGPVFENSTACVYVETSTGPRLARYSDQQLPEEESTLSHLLREVDFERKLEVKRPIGFGRSHFFTESLILAQDERWRRA
jgi:hypothetical protein